MKEVSIRFEAAPALDRIEVLIRAPAEDEQVAAIRRRLSEFASETLVVFDRHEVRRLIAVEDVVSVSVNDKLVSVTTESGSYFTRQPLHKLEAALSGARFVRISRYELVNLAKVRRFDFTLAGTLRLELAGGTETWASRRCIPEIRRRLKEMG